MGPVTPELLGGGGLSWRMMTYYDLAMGGATINGTDVGTLAYIRDTVLTANQIDQAASISISYKDITDSSFTAKVDISALMDITDSVVLHLPISQSQMSWKTFFPSGMSPNGQTEMFNVVWKLPGDTLGNPIGKLAKGSSFTSEFSITVDTLLDKSKLQTTAIIQNPVSKKVIAFAQNGSSPFGASSVVSNSVLKSNQFTFSITSAGVLTGTAHTSGVVTLFRPDGREMASHNITPIGGTFSCSVPSMATGMYLVQLKTADQQTHIQRVMLQ